MSAYWNVLTPYNQSPPESIVWPVSLSELKTHLKLPEYSPPDSSLDAYLQVLLNAAHEEAEAKQNRDLAVRTWKLTAYAPLAQELQLRADCASIDSVTLFDGDTQTEADASTYTLDAARSRLVWEEIPSCDRVEVVHTTAGVSAIAESLKAGILLLAGWLYQQGMPRSGVSSAVLAAYPVAIERLLTIGGFHCAAVL